MRRFIVILLIAGVAYSVNAFDVMKFERMLDVTTQREKIAGRFAQEKNRQLKKILKSNKSAEIMIETSPSTPNGEKQKLANDLVNALKSVVDIIEKQLDKAVNLNPNRYLPKNLQGAVSAIKDDIRPLVIEIGHLQSCSEIYKATVVFNALLRILYYTQTKEAPVIQIMFYHPEAVPGAMNSDKLFVGALTDRIIKALIQIKNFDGNFKPTGNKDSNPLEIEVTKRLNLKSPQQKWEKSDFLGK